METQSNHEARSISIAKTEEREVNGKKFTEYIIDITDSNGYEYTIARRFSEFYQLYQLMYHNFQIKFNFPPKKLNKLSLELIDQRKKSLQQFIVFLIQNPSSPIKTSFDLLRFLDQNNPVFSNKLVKKKVTFEDMKQKGLSIEITIIEGKDLKREGSKSMWDMESICIYEIGKPIGSFSTNTPTSFSSSHKTTTLSGPYPQWAYKQKIQVDKSLSPIIYFKVLNSKAVSANENNDDSTTITTTAPITSSTPPGKISKLKTQILGSSKSDLKIYEEIGKCQVDISNSSNLSINNYTPTFLSLPLDKGGEIVVSLQLA